jgi:hypothetical protein
MRSDDFRRVSEMKPIRKTMTLIAMIIHSLGVNVGCCINLFFAILGHRCARQAYHGNPAPGAKGPGWNIRRSTSPAFPKNPAFDAYPFRASVSRYICKRVLRRPWMPNLSISRSQARNSSTESL